MRDGRKARAMVVTARAKAMALAKPLRGDKGAGVQTESYDTQVEAGYSCRLRDPAV